MQAQTALFASPTVLLHTMVVFMGNLRISTMATVLLLGGCAHHPMTDTIAVSGGQNLRFTRVGAGFVKAENERLVVDEAGLTTYRTEGKNFVRWQFAILPKEETALRLVRIEDVTNDKPVLILEDRAPQIDERRWSRQSDLVHADTRAIPWLFEFGRTIRVFRITVRERNGKTSILYQAVLFTPKAKKDFRVLMGPETFENAVNADNAGIAGNVENAAGNTKEWATFEMSLRTNYAESRRIGEGAVF